MRWALRGTHPSLRHSSVRLVSGDSLGTGAAPAASVAAHAHRMPCRRSGCPSKHPTTRPSLRLIMALARDQRERALHLRMTFHKGAEEECRVYTKFPVKTPRKLTRLICALRSNVASYEYCHTEWTYKIDGKKIRRAIKAQRASIAHRKVRGTRTAETDMCN